MTIRQRRVLITNLANSIMRELDQIEEVMGAKAPFALTEQEYTWQIKAKDYARCLADIDINEKVTS